MDKENESPWLCVSESARLLNCNIATIYRHIQKGKIPHKKIGTKYLIQKEFVLQCEDYKEDK